MCYNSIFQSVGFTHMLTILHVTNTTRWYTDFHIYNIKLLLAIHQKDVIILLYLFQMKIEA